VRRLGAARLVSPRRVRALVVAAATASIVTAANASQGAYFSQSWGWVALSFLVPTTVLLILDCVDRPGPLRLAFFGLMGALAVWTALSATWSISSSGSVREAERMLVYLAVGFAVAVVVRRGDGAGLVAGALLGTTVVCSYALATRLFPNVLEAFDSRTNAYRLSAALGYWNSLGLFAAMGVLLALGVVAHARRQWAGVAAATTLPILASTLYFTFSRGAWGALALGFVVMVALDPRRLRLVFASVVVLPATAACTLLASRQVALTTEGSSLPAAARAGHREAAFTIALALCSAALALVARRLASRLFVTRRARRAFDFALVGAVLVAVLGAFVYVGGPDRGLTSLREHFDAAPTGSADQNTRLFSLSNNGRVETIHVAWNEGRSRPLVGTGAGTFEYVWYERRPSQGIVRDAHSLYVETFAELGIVGLALLIAVLTVPFVAALRARRTRFVPVGAAVLAAWAGASALDWHWEMVGVTTTAFLAAACGLVACERGRRVSLRRSVGLAAAGLGCVLSVFAVVSLVGNQALFAGKDAVAGRDWAAAQQDARKASRLLPWSYEPYLVLGDAEAGLGSRGDAIRAYRKAVEIDPRNWVAWLRLAQVERGAQRADAYSEIRRLNPREQGLPGMP
jgi:O-antigen ligase